MNAERDPKKWKEPPFCDDYLVSTDGEVYSKKTGKLLKPRIGRDGRYLVVDLQHKGTRWYKRIHRLVAETFIPNPNTLPEVNHIDGNKLNNRVNNLEWCTQKENVQHAHVNGLVNIHHKLSDDEIRFIRQKYIPYSKEFGTRGLSRLLHVSHSAVIYALNGGHTDVN